MRGVSSVDPSSTMTHSAGRTVCATTVSSVWRMYSASLRHGDIRTYRLLMGPDQSVAAASRPANIQGRSPRPARHESLRNCVVTLAPASLPDRAPWGVSADRTESAQSLAVGRRNGVEQIGHEDVVRAIRSRGFGVDRRNTK